MLFQIWIVTIVHIFDLLRQLLHPMLHFLETLSEICIHKAIKSSFCWLIVLFTCIDPIYSWRLLDHSLSMRKVVCCGAAHFLFVLIFDANFLHRLWHTPRSSQSTLLLCIGTILWESRLIYLHPFLNVILLSLLLLGLLRSCWWFLINDSFDPLLSCYFILLVANCSWLPERLRDTGFILQKTLNPIFSVVIVWLNLIYAARTNIISF